jgi:hypothetical protein
MLLARRARYINAAASTPVSTGWPDDTNTGYLNSPTYTGSLTTFSGTIQSNHTYNNYVFNDNAAVGNSSNTLVNVTFNGCKFMSNNVDDANVAVYGDNIIFNYCTFMPSTVSAPPTTHNQGYQYPIDQRYNGALTIDHCNVWGYGNAIQFAFSSQAKPFICRHTYIHDARDDGGVDHTDGILENYGGSASTMAYGVIDHNRIISYGNTNAIALQGSGGYHNFTVTNNWCSGFGYTYNVGGTATGNRNMIFTDNVFSNTLQPGFGPMYGWEDGNGNLWRRNKFNIVHPPTWGNNGGWAAPVTLADDGKYWWPDGGAYTTDYTG